MQRAFRSDGNGGVVIKYPLITLIITLLFAMLPYVVSAVTISNNVEQITKDINRIDYAREKVWTEHGKHDSTIGLQLAECQVQTALLQQSLNRMERDISEIKTDIKSIKVII